MIHGLDVIEGLLSANILGVHTRSLLVAESFPGTEPVCIPFIVTVQSA